MVLSENELKLHFDSEIHRWFADKGDQTHRLEYPLNANSVVVDLGGYEGGWSEEIFRKYGCHIHIFEPVKSFYDPLKNKFSENKKIHCYQYGLGGAEGDFDIFHSGDGTSMHIDSGSNDKESITIKRADEFFVSLSCMVDLLKVNIEGAEYELLPHLINTGAIKKIKNLQVQFHTFMPDCQNRRNLIRKSLSKTHVLGYNYDFVWENWELKQEKGKSGWVNFKKYSFVKILINGLSQR